MQQLRPREQACLASDVHVELAHHASVRSSLEAQRPQPIRRGEYLAVDEEPARSYVQDCLAATERDVEPLWRDVRARQWLHSLQNTQLWQAAGRAVASLPCVPESLLTELLEMVTTAS